MQHSNNQDLPEVVRQWLAKEPAQDQIGDIDIRLEDAKEFPRDFGRFCELCERTYVPERGETEYPVVRIRMEQSAAFYEDTHEFQPCPDCAEALEEARVALSKRTPEFSIPNRYLTGGFDLWLKRNANRRIIHINRSFGRVGVRLRLGNYRSVYSESNTVQRATHVALERWIDPDCYSDRVGRQMVYRIPDRHGDGPSVVTTPDRQTAFRLLLDIEGF
jgi:hypothetical protein